MQPISRDNLIKRIRAEFLQELPEFRVFLYPMDRWSMTPETIGILAQITFLDEHIISHLRAPVDPDGNMLVEDPDDTAQRLVANFRGSIRSLISARQYRNEQNLFFGEALVALRYGAHVARTGWNGRDMLVALIPGSKITVEEGRPLAAAFSPGTEVDYAPHIDMKTADGKIVPWTASQTDILARDWRLV